VADEIRLVQAVHEDLVGERRGGEENFGLSDGRNGKS
jgi:hypothetical protein